MRYILFSLLTVSVIAEAAINWGNFDVKGNLKVSNQTASTVPYLDASKNVTSSSVTPTELGYVHGVTSAIQTQLNAALTNPMTTGGDIIYGGASGTPTRLANGTVGQYVKSAGGTSPETWASFTAHTATALTANGSAAGYVFTVTSATAAAGDTYTNNGHTYTVVKAIAAGTTLYMSGALAPAASGNLVRSAGSGTDPIVFSANLPLAAYSTPSTAKAIVVECVGAGGAGGGAIATGASQNACGAGGGGAGYARKLISSPEATYYYYIPPAIAGVAGNTGTNGASVYFAGANNALTGAGGTGGANSGVCGASVFCTGSGGGGGAGAGGDVNISGSGGSSCISLAAGAQAGSGSGGASELGQPGLTGGQNIGNSAGTNAGNYGAGGGGGLNGASQAGTKAGGTSSQGACFIMEFYNGN